MIQAGRAGPEAILEVTDTGTGIPAGELPHIFDRFWRGQHAAQTSGSGIGLTIAVELAWAHGGHLAASSQPGEGTHMTLTPRLAPEARTSACRTHRAGTAGSSHRHPSPRHRPCTGTGLAGTSHQRDWRSASGTRSSDKGAPLMKMTERARSAGGAAVAARGDRGRRLPRGDRGGTRQVRQRTGRRSQPHGARQLRGRGAPSAALGGTDPHPGRARLRRGPRPGREHRHQRPRRRERHHVPGPGRRGAGPARRPPGGQLPAR